MGFLKFGSQKPCALGFFSVFWVCVLLRCFLFRDLKSGFMCFCLRVFYVFSGLRLFSPPFQVELGLSLMTS